MTVSKTAALRQQDTSPWPVRCARKGCSEIFAPVKGKLYHSGACRAAASRDARYIRKPVKRKPTTSRAWVLAAEYLRGRV